MTRKQWNENANKIETTTPFTFFVDEMVFCYIMEDDVKKVQSHNNAVNGRSKRNKR